MSSTQMSSDDESTAAFVQLIADGQSALFAYAANLVGDPEAARNVLQEANLVIWKKSQEFQAGSSFLAWARKIVYFQALAHLRDSKRSCMVFDEEVVQKLATIEPLQDIDERRLALRECLAGLRDDRRTIIMERYYGQQSVQSIAEHLGKSPGAVSKKLMRIRQALMRCIEERVATQ